MIYSLQDSSKSLIATAIGHFANDGLLGIFPIIYPILLLQTYSFTPSSIGVIGATLNAFAIVMSPFIGRRSDARRNFARLMIIGVVTVAVGLAGFALALGFFHGIDLFLVLILFASIAGFGSSFYHPVGAAIIDEQIGRKNRGRAFGINGSMGTFGMVSFPIIAVALIGVLGTASIILLSFGGLATAASIYMLIRKVRFRSIPDLRYEGSQEGKLGPSSSSGTGPQKAWRSQRITVPLKVVIPPILALTIYSFITSVFSQSVTQFLPLYLNSVDHVQYSYVALAASVMPGMGIISQPVVGQLTDMFDRRLVLAISSLGALVAMLLFVVASNILEAEIFLAISGMFQFTGFPLILGLSNEISLKDAKTFSSSIVWGVGFVGGGVVGPIVLGMLAEPAFLGSLSMAFLAVTFIGFFAVPLIPFIPKPTRSN